MQRVKQVCSHIEVKMQVAALKPKEDLTKVPTPEDIVRRGNLVEIKFKQPIIEYQLKVRAAAAAEAKKQEPS